MKLITRLLASLLLILSIQSCGHKTTHPVDKYKITLDAKSSYTLSDVVDSVTYLALPDIDGHFIKRPNKIRFVDGRIYLFDSNQGLVCVYDSATGAPVTALHRIGQGPEDYAHAYAFTVDSDYIYIVDGKRVQMYDPKTAEFLKTANLSFYISDIEAVSPNRIVTTRVDMAQFPPTPNQPDYRLIFVDTTMAITSTYYPAPGGDPIGQPSYFSPTSDGVIFGSVLFDGFTFIPSSLTDSIRRYEIDFTDGIKPHGNVPFEEIGDYQYLSAVPIMCGDYSYMMLNFGKGSSENRLWNSAIGGFIPLDGEGFLPFYTNASTGDSFVAFLDSRPTYDMFVEAGLSPAPDSVQRALDDESMALLFYHMRPLHP